MKSLISEIKVTYNYPPDYKLEEIHSSKTAYEYFKDRWPCDIQFRECFLVAFLNRRNQVLGHFVVSMGGISETIVDNKLIFATALVANSSSIILAHNHPSGNLKPSHADLQVTKRIVEAGKILDIKVLDHLILTADNYFSFGDEGHL